MFRLIRAQAVCHLYIEEMQQKQNPARVLSFFVAKQFDLFSSSSFRNVELSVARKRLNSKHRKHLPVLTTLTFDK